MKLTGNLGHHAAERRTPHGVRGLKSEDQKGRNPNGRSRTPHGVRGLKYPGLSRPVLQAGRTPHGVRGLKSHVLQAVLDLVEVAPLTGCVD